MFIAIGKHIKIRCIFAYVNFLHDLDQNLFFSIKRNLWPKFVYKNEYFKFCFALENTATLGFIEILFFKYEFSLDVAYLVIILVFFDQVHFLVKYCF